MRVNKERNPYSGISIHRVLWHIRSRKNTRHRMFWAVEYIPGPVIYIYYCGLFSICWSEVYGWHWGGWNFD